MVTSAEGTLYRLNFLMVSDVLSGTLVIVLVVDLMIPLTVLLRSYAEFSYCE